MTQPRQNLPLDSTGFPGSDGDDCYKEQQWAIAGVDTAAKCAAANGTCFFIATCGALEKGFELGGLSAGDECNEYRGKNYFPSNGPVSVLAAERINYCCTSTTAPVVAILSAAEKAVAPKVVSKMTLDRELTAAEQTSTKSGYAAAAGVPVENVEMSKDARRQSKVSYSVTVYVKDAAAAQAVSTKLSNPDVVKAALIAAVLHHDPHPTVC